MPSEKVDGWPPRWLTSVPAADVARGDGEHCSEFIEALCKVTKDSVAGASGAPILLRPWQRQAIGHLLARREDGRYRHRQALIGVARKNGKSALGAGLALYGLVMGPDGGEVYSCAGEKEQARIVFGTARRMVEMEPELADVCKLYRDAIEIPATGSVYRVLSAEAFSKEGLNPTMVLFDEVHVQPTRELWDVMALAMGARVEPLMVGITTAGVKSDSTGGDSLCYSLYQHGKRVASGEVDDPSFFMAWWEPTRSEGDHRLPDTWREANPGFADLVSEEDFESSVRKTPESEFRTKRCNQWVSSAVTWLPAGAWEACADVSRKIKPHDPVVLGFDGSKSGDCTGLVAVSVDPKPHIEVLGLWEKPRDQLEWTVPRAQVKDAIREACRTYDVKEIAWDEFLWLDAAEDLEAEGLPVVVFPQNITRMGPATQRMYESVTDKEITHSADPRLARHFANCTTKTDARGTRIVKDKPNSPRKIDLAVCGVMALERAAWYLANDTDPLQNIW
ncbi:MAG: terminase large subunit [Streptomyces sp.]|nr:terminase large subunit [Streptomyces sp.]